MQEETDGDGRERKTRLYVYWGTSTFATLIFLWFAYVMMMVPGVPSADKLWMLSVAGASLAVPLCVGTWKFATTEAPIMTWPFGTVVAVLLCLEFVMCIINIFGVAHDTWIP
jgi:hypothetical protein